MAIITLTSDIGTKDYLPGAIKGRLLCINNGFNVCDISHHVPPYDYNEAVYIINNAYPAYPMHSWHCLFINLFDSITPRLLLAFHQGHYFACADNGLLTMMFKGLPQQVIELPLPAEAGTNVLLWADAIGHAIHDMDNGAAFHQLGAEADNLVVKTNLEPIINDDWIEGRIIFIDRFENVVVNIKETEFEQARRGRNFTIVLKSGEPITRLGNGYAQVEEGTRLAFFNTAGYLEIAVNKANAAGLFGFQKFDSKANQKIVRLRMFYQTVRVYFE